METEEKIVYSIIETANNGGVNDDALINERIVRSFLATYRGSIIEKYSDAGISVSDELFQTLPGQEFLLLRDRLFTKFLPKIIRLKNMYGASGIKFEKQDENIPILSGEEFNNSLKSIINKYHPKAKFVGSLATIYIGKKNLSPCAAADGLNSFVDVFEKEFLSSDKNLITVDITAILENPDDDPGYDWTRSPYPLDSESIAELKSQILSREYNIVFQAKTDKVTDGDDSKE